MTFKNTKLMKKEIVDLCGFYDIKDSLDIPLLLIQKNFLIFCQKKKKPAQDEAKIYMDIDCYTFEEQFEDIYNFYEDIA